MAEQKTDPQAMTDHDLLVGIYKAANGIKNMILLWWVLTVIGAIVLFAQAQDSGNGF